MICTCPAKLAHVQSIPSAMHCYQAYIEQYFALFIDHDVIMNSCRGWPMLDCATTSQVSGSINAGVAGMVKLLSKPLYILSQLRLRLQLPYFA